VFISQVYVKVGYEFIQMLYIKYQNLKGEL